LISAYFAGYADGIGRENYVVSLMQGRATGRGFATHAQPLSLDFNGIAAALASGIAPASIVMALLGNADGAGDGIGYSLIKSDMLGEALLGGDSYGLLSADFRGWAKAWGVVSGPVGVEEEDIDFIVEAPTKLFSARGRDSQFVAPLLEKIFNSNDLKGA
jgi:hypothetical protein